MQSNENKTKPFTSLFHPSPRVSDLRALEGAWNLSSLVESLERLKSEADVERVSAPSPLVSAAREQIVPESRPVSPVLGLVAKQEASFSSRVRRPLPTISENPPQAPHISSMKRRRSEDSADWRDMMDIERLSPEREPNEKRAR